MTKTNNVIELNGKRYDATSGALVGEARASAPAMPEVHAKPKPHVVQRGVVVDGIVRNGTLPAASSGSGSRLSTIPVTPAPTKIPSAARSIKLLQAHQPQHTKTLMRHLVKPPKSGAKKITPQVPTDLIKKQPAALAVKPKLSSDLIDEQRAERAKTIPRSGALSRFYRTPTQTQSMARAHVPNTAPTPQRPQHQGMATRTTEGIIAAPRARTPAVTSRTRMFEQAIATADSHDQPAPKTPIKHKRRSGRKHIKIASIAASGAVVLLLGVFIAYQNKANLQLQVASAKAGFQANMPNYKPEGFTVKGLSYHPGTVIIGFASTNHQAFNVTQKVSNWDSQTLLENFVATNNQPYQAYQVGGRTVYIYGNDKATWVNGGIWYQLEGNAHLGKQQILSLASSM